MNQGILFSSSKKFRHVLNQLTCHKVFRSVLINIAITEFQLSEKQAAGLIDRGVYQLKKQGLVRSDGRIKNISYLFSFGVISHSQHHVVNDETLVLSSERERLENELSLTRYEQEAYQELLDKIPRQKRKIIKLQQDTDKKLKQLNGKLRAIHQLLSL
ncbi:MAG TPA: hypothetical protein DCF88_13945 [Plesiomonas shigelloides]|uniref:hypothetical protein n=1 Tax=Plesiomonas shigelloides TaxID=703 RepID=UPI000ED6DD76|nr:hypothetical protein [Plesiomonas shigelloides]QIY08145.1 hypothetical protein FOC33_03815 [Plesiomonas shigelloides]HAD41193.1 hypothetical protein [Plesiomonas shigelloides]